MDPRETFPINEKSTLGAALAAFGTDGKIVTDLEVSPNPAVDEIDLTFTPPSDGSYTIALYDSRGALRKQNVVPGQAGKKLAVRLNVSSGAVGAGLIVISSKDRSLAVKSIIITK